MQVSEQVQPEANIGTELDQQNVANTNQQIVEPGTAAMIPSDPFDVDSNLQDNPADANAGNGANARDPEVLRRATQAPTAEEVLASQN